MSNLLAPPLDLEKAAHLVERGLPWPEADFLAKQIGVTLAQLAALLGISQPTFFRRRKQKRFPTAESDHLMRFARVWSLAMDVFEDEDGARKWLKDPAVGLSGRVPLTVCRTEVGAREVETLLHRIDYNIPT